MTTMTRWLFTNSFLMADIESDVAIIRLRGKPQIRN